MFYVLYWTFRTMFLYCISVSIQLVAAIRNKPFIHKYLGISLWYIPSLIY